MAEWLRSGLQSRLLRFESGRRLLQQPDGLSLYDAIPYPGHAFAQTHPDRLATLAALFGLHAAPPATCRLLEIGCGDGANLLPMAVALPEATFVGLDSSTNAIAAARAVADELGLENARFELAGLEEFDTPAGSFDYVIAHGVFSWVPDDIRERLLALCAHALTDSGVAYVSYNALPGARVPQTLYELLRLKLRDVEAPGERIAAARRLLELLSGPNEQATMLGPEAASLLRQPESLLFHDALAPHNTPFFFREFAARAAGHGLQYLAEANFLEMQAGFLPEEIRRELLDGADVLEREQVLDQLKVRRFRQTLLCPAAARLDRALDSARIAHLVVSSPATVLVEDPAVPERVTFEAPGGSRLTTEHEVVVAALTRAAQSWPAAVAIADMLPADAAPQDRDTLSEALLRCFAGNVVQLGVHPPALSPRAGERPLASPLARLQAREGLSLANLRHATVKLEGELGRRLLMLLDGTRDRGDLREQLDGVDGATGDELVARIETGLAQLARSALLLA